jgi:hypothetical protein
MDLEFFHVFFMVGAAITAIWWLWVCLSKTQPLIPTGTWRAILLGSVVVNLAILFYVLTTWASWDVRGDPYYLIGYASLGFLWVYGTVPWLGTFADIRIRQDVRGHNNVAAATLIAAFTIGTTLAYSGGNIGDGPGWYVVAFCAVLSTATVYGVAFIVAMMTDAEEHITIDHDLGAAIRLGGAIVATGLIAGRAVAGNWYSVGGTLVDFAVTAWPILIIAVAAVVIEKVMPPNYLANTFLRSIAVAVFMIGGAGVYVWTLGVWK